MKTLLFFAFVLGHLNAFAHMEPERLEAIQVVDHNEAQTLVDFVPTVTTVKGKELQKQRQQSVGETIQKEAGVSSTYFGPSSSRPVIRGLDGDRIRILQNGLGTLDASTQSLDHAIPVDTLTVDQIEIVRGPMALLYGSSAVGGVVNLLTNRIHTVYEKGFFSQALVQGETVNNGISSALHLNYGANRWMFHADGSTRNFGDTKIPPHVKGGPDQKKGVLPNSFNQQDNFAFGVSNILDQGQYGLSYNHFNTTYGSVAAPGVTIDMFQNRAELHTEWRPENAVLFRSYRLRSAQSEYHHREIENGVTGTTFENRGNETRIEAFNKNHDWQGVSGLQTQIFKFSAKGEEAFLPTSDNTKAGLFTYQEKSLSVKNSLSAGARVESSGVKKHSDPNFGASDEKNFVLLNGSLGYKYDFTAKNSLSSSFSYTERAPNFQELYARGDHIASGSYEQGKSTLARERAYAFELSQKFSGSKSRLVVNAYTQVFKNFISLNPTGATGNSPGGLTEYQYQQVDALFYGADLESRQELMEWRKGVLTLVGTADIVRAKDTDSGHNLPRISPPRLNAGLEYARGNGYTDLEVQYVAHQTKTAPGEKWTDSYTLTNAGYMYDIIGENYSVSVFARVRNIFDVEARSHVSLIKEIAPLPGRNFILGIQAQL